MILGADFDWKCATLLYTRFYLVVVVVAVREECSGEMPRDKVISLTYSTTLRVNVGVSAYFVQVQIHLALERVHRVCKGNFLRQIVPWDSHSVENEVCSRLVSLCALTSELNHFDFYFKFLLYQKFNF